MLPSVTVRKVTGMSRPGHFEDVAAPQWRAMLDTHLAAPYALLQAVVPAMRGRTWGRIILVSSGAGEEGWEGAAAYATAISVHRSRSPLAACHEQ